MSETAAQVETKKSKKPSKKHIDRDKQLQRQQQKELLQQQQQQQEQEQLAQEQQPQQQQEGGKSSKMPSLRLDLNVDAEIYIKAKVHGDVTLSLLS
jgi:hypothetical protein